MLVHANVKEPHIFPAASRVCMPLAVQTRICNTLLLYLLSDLKQLTNKPELMLSAAPSARPVARRRLWLRSAPKRTICYKTRAHTHRDTHQSKWTPLRRTVHMSKGFYFAIYSSCKQASESSERRFN